MESSGRIVRVVRVALVMLVMAAFAAGCASASAAWSISTLSLPAGTTESTLNSVDCTGEICWAVGDYRTASHGLEPLAYQPASNSYALPPSPGNAAELNDISCASNNFCMAVGRFVNAGGNFQAFAEKYTLATGWVLQSMTYPTGNFSSELGSVSCSSSSECMAVGDYHKLPVGLQYLAEHWSSSAWAPETPAEPAGIGYQSLNAISCPAAGKCVAVGSYRTSPWGTGTQRMETENFSTTWAYQGVSFWPGSGSLPYIGDNSCFSLTNCIGVGFFTPGSPAFEVLAYEKLAPPASPDWGRQTSMPALGEADLHGVYCPAITTSCYAAGRQVVSGVAKPLALHLLGTTWTQITLPTIGEGSFGRVSCMAEAFFCAAVGRTGTKALVETGP